MNKDYTPMIEACEGHSKLTDWEDNFLVSIESKPTTLTEKQIEVLERIYEKVTR